MPMELRVGAQCFNLAYIAAVISRSRNCGPVSVKLTD